VSGGGCNSDYGNVSYHPAGRADGSSPTPGSNDGSSPLSPLTD
jgi:hypothetical protein